MSGRAERLPGAAALARQMHPYLGAWYQTLVLLHVVSAFLFVLVHGPSIAALWRLRVERELPAVRALLDMSRAWSGYSWMAWGFLAVTGSALASVRHGWRAPWVWGSVVVLVLVSGAMSPLAARAFNEARHAAGLPYFDGKGMQPARPPDERALASALAVIRERSLAIAAIGFVGLALLVWLMVERPG